MLGLVLLGLLAGRWTGSRLEVQKGGFAASQTAAGDWLPTPRPAGPTVALTINFGNGAERRFAALAWREDLSVLGAMEAAAGFRPGVSFAYSGKGESAFLTAIDGLQNAGVGGGNWIYEINGEKPTKSIARTTLQPGDTLLWRYSGSP